MTSRNRIAWVSVAMTLAAVLGVSAAVMPVLPAARASAAPVDAEFTVSVSATEATVAPGDAMRITVEVTNAGAVDYGARALVGVSVSWPGSILEPSTSSSNAPTGCVAWGDEESWYTEDPAAVPEASGDVCYTAGAGSPGGTATFELSFVGRTGVVARTGQFTIRTEALVIEPGGDPPGWDVISESSQHSAFAPVSLAAFRVSVLPQVPFEGVGGHVAVYYLVREVEGALDAELQEGADTPDYELDLQLTWPPGFTVVDDAGARENCNGGFSAAGLCTITVSDGTAIFASFMIEFAAPGSIPSKQSDGEFAIAAGPNGWYYPPFEGPAIAIAPAPAVDTALFRTRGIGSGSGARGASFAAARGSDVGTAAVPLAAPLPSGAVPIPVAWVMSDTASFSVARDVFPITVDLDTDVGWPGSPGVVATYRISHDPDVSLAFDAEVEFRPTWPAFIHPSGSPEGCNGWDPVEQTCLLTGLDEPGSSQTVTLRFASPGEEIGEGMIGAEGVEVRQSFGATENRPLPVEWIVPQAIRYVVDFENFTVDVALDREFGWPAGPDLMVEVTVTYARGMKVSADSPFVGLRLDWTELLGLADPPGVEGCDSYVDSVCTITGLEAEGDQRVIRLRFTMPDADVGPATVSATAEFLRNGVPNDYSELPTAWVGSDSEDYEVRAPRIDVALDVSPQLSWDGGPIVVAQIQLTADDLLGERIDHYRVRISVDVPGFLVPVSVDGCLGAAPDCVVEPVLGGSGAAVVTMRFRVAPDGKGSGQISVTGVELIAVASDKAGTEYPLPPEWIGADEEPVEAIRPTIGLDLTLDHDPGYTGGEQLVVTTTVTRENPGAKLDGLVIGLDFEWAGYLTRTTQTGCATFAGTTCTVKGLDEPGASAVVRLTFAMPPPTLPPNPIQAPRTDDLAVDGVSLSFDPPPAKPLPPPTVPDPDPDPPTWPPDGCYINADGVCVCENQSQVCPPEPTSTPTPTPGPEPQPEPVDGTLPPSWIGQDREPFTVLQPNLLFSQSVATPGDGIEAFGAFLPPNARITLRWEGASPTVGTQWPNPANPTEGRWSLVVLRWQGVGEQQLVMHSEDGLFADVPTSNALLVVPRSAMGPDLVGRGG
ncbi:hypothetical protein SAMN05428970_0633 [Agromyces sp. CF514]|uniref:hypothetical protein n=1 Tax=Agromyces sp. CF514 TaxID=1881031 RepID=UPI0008ED80DD|nr:hypothetical protein [Agromyces sp. CF514]SFR69214.1 hypothetical protein SAMN05428970_0633 [Agromyces sp. CF514]